MRDPCGRAGTLTRCGAGADGLALAPGGLAAAGGRRRRAAAGRAKVPSCLATAGLAALIAAAGGWRAACWAGPVESARRPRPRSPSVAVAAFDLGGLFGGDDEFKFQVPVDSANVVQGLKDSTENTLNAGISRLDVECPPSFVFGVEAKENKGKVMQGDLDPKNKAKVETSNIELARVFVEMLYPIGKDLVIAFRNDKLAAAAKKKWRLQDGEGKIISFPGKSKSAFAAEVGAPLQFKAKLKRLGCQCLVVVAPEKDQLRLVADLSDEYQDQMGIILLNSRIHGAGRSAIKCPPKLKRKLQADFPPSYHIRFLEGGRKNAVLFRMRGPEGTEEPWILAQQRELLGKVGCASAEVARFDSVEEPTDEEIDEAFRAFDKKDGDLRDKVIGLLEEK